MGIFSESESEREVREHNEGQKDGSQADVLDKIVHNVRPGGGSDAYKAGYDNGVENPASDDDEDDEDD